MLHFITHSHKLPFDTNGRLVPSHTYMTSPGEGPSVDIGLSHGCQTLETETQVTVKHQEEFLGLVFNLGNDLPYSFNNYSLAGTLRKNNYNIVYIPPGAILQYNLKKGRYEVFCMRFTMDYLQFWARYFPLLNNLLQNVKRQVPCTINTVALEADTEMHNMIKEVLEGAYTITTREAFINARLYAIIFLCLRQITGSPACLNTELIEVKKARDYLSYEMEKHWTLDLLASKVDIGRKKLSRAFRKIHGQSVMEYLYDERMKKAVILLRDSAMPIKKIAITVGYKNVPNFSEAFHRKYGYPPGELRKRDANQEQ